jgi:hypothetical protein
MLHHTYRILVSFILQTVTLLINLCPAINNNMPSIYSIFLLVQYLDRAEMALDTGPDVLAISELTR